MSNNDITLASIVGGVGEGREQAWHEVGVDGILVLRAGAAIACYKDDFFLTGLLLHCHLSLLRGIMARMEVEEHPVG